MGRRLRYLPPEGSGLVEVTTRTIHGRFLLTPCEELNDLILGALGRAQELYPVGLVAFAFASALRCQPLRPAGEAHAES